MHARGVIVVLTFSTEAYGNVLCQLRYGIKSQNYIIFSLYLRRVV